MPQIPGFVYTAAYTALVTFLTLISTGIEAEVTELWGPILLAGIALLTKMVLVMKSPADSVSRNISRPASKIRTFLLG